MVEVPFSNHSGVKLRPALIVSAHTFHRELSEFIVCPISSQPRYYQRPGQGDVPLLDWRAVGLRHPSTARIAKLLSVDKAVVRRPLGMLSRRDLGGVEARLRRALVLP